MSETESTEAPQQTPQEVYAQDLKEARIIDKAVEQKIKERLLENGRTQAEVDEMTRPATPEEIQASINSSKANQAKMAELKQRIQELDKQEKEVKQGFHISLPWRRKSE